MPSLFMAGQDGPYFGLMAQGLMNRHAGAARIGKDDVYTFTHEHSTSTSAPVMRVFVGADGVLSFVLMCK